MDRNTRDVLNLLHEIYQKGASLQVLKITIDTAGAMGKSVYPFIHLFNAAEAELPLQEVSFV